MRLTNDSASRFPQSWQLPISFVKGAISILPLSISVFAYGLPYGALANNTNHLTLFETVFMSFFVFSGAGQFSLLAFLQQSASISTILLSMFLINSRHILYGLSIGKDLKNVSISQLVIPAHLISDESYSISSLEGQKGKLDVLFLLGAGLVVFFSWILASIVGFYVGEWVGDPKQVGLDFAFTAAFLGMLIAQLKHRWHFLAAILALLLSSLTYHILGLSAAVFTGGIVAFLVGVFVKEDTNTATSK
ncbi:AzlC family ABC transporter permease [Bacillus kwashiorkori]|uniref:AzlC family ABC transporter permease n=1 Tax=Bacillus kwashiorkori TaxID=1522318 RepID=UPI0007806AD3|nr:AzlC family ABC transporter permease [Bacillus kwashiorkori]